MVLLFRVLALLFFFLLLWPVLLYSGNAVAHEDSQNRHHPMILITPADTIFKKG